MDQVVTDPTERTPIAHSHFRLHEAVQHARSNGPASLAEEFLPPTGDPQRLAVLLAIMRADLNSSESTNARRVTEYQNAFPDLTTDSQARGFVTALQTHAIETVTPMPGSWPKPPSKADFLPSAPSARSAPPLPPAPPEVVEQPEGNGMELPPEVAENLGFTNLVQLGKGGFGSVYLAEQPTLNGRQVAIKYTAVPSRESQVLAALHHPNIVPVWSVHEYQGARVFCMPFHGKHTLADILHQIDQTKSLPATGAGFLSVAAPPKSAVVVAPLAVAPKAELIHAEDAEPDDQWGYYETDRQRLNRLSYVDSVVMGVTRLADALVHAHCRRVIHLDIKPANILITDDGVFMILDFGLAHQDGVGPSCNSGGTIRYMAPEQLTQFINGAVKPDVRMDLYSLGVVFYELLTGRHPFAASMAPNVPMHQRIAARRQPPPSVRAFNPSVSPTVEAIVQHLLQPDRTKRYQSAEHLVVDLTRHQQHLPLKFAPNPSLWERVAKFRRRHPVFAVALMALVLGMIALAAIGIAGRLAQQSAERKLDLERSDAISLAEKVKTDQGGIRIDAGSIERQTTRDAAIAAVEKWWREYGVETDPDWRTRPNFARLSDEQKSVLLLTLVEQGLLAAHAERVNAAGRPADVANPALDRAANWNRRAEAILGGRQLPPVLFEQQTELARLRGLPVPAARPDDLADESNLDLYLRGLARISERKYPEAADVLLRLITAESYHAAGQFALGVVYQTTGRYYEAIERYQVAKALAKTDPRPPYNRGALLNFHNQLPEALDELSTALSRDPTLVEAYYQRAIVRLKDPKLTVRELTPALDDINKAIELGGVSYRYLSLRQMIHTRMGNAVAADDDLKAMATIPFRDELDDLERANRALRPLRPNQPVRIDRLAERFAGATGVVLAEEYRKSCWRAARLDYQAAVKRNPLCSNGWQGLAAVESELKLTDEAIATLRVVIELLPGDTQHQFNRAVLLARVGKRNEAVRQIAGVKPDAPFKWYQTACVYAQTADTNLQDTKAAMNALQQAINLGFKEYEMMKQDPDLDNLRNQPGFEELISGQKKGAE